MRATTQFLFSVAMGCLFYGNLPAADTDLKKSGAFGFPQSEAKVLCDTDQLRVSAWSNATYLYVQAIVWNDDDDTATKGKDGRMIGDTSTLVLDVDSDQLRTPRIDRTYALNPWPALPGLHYQILMGERASTGLMTDSEGRGGIKYVEVADGKRVRVDSFLVPLAEIDLKAGDTLRLAYRGASTVPEMTVNSVGYKGEGQYYDYHLPLDKFNEIKLEQGTTLSAEQVPELRRARPSAADPTDGPAPTLTVGSVAPSLNIEHWVQDGEGKFKPVTKFDPQKVYIVEFWATWCGPCIAAMPHIVELQHKYADEGLQVVSISDEDLETVEKFLQRKVPAKEGEDEKTFGELTKSYCLTTDPDESCHESYMRAAGQNGIPCAFLVGKEGKIEWIGHPMSIDKPLKSVLAGDWDREEYLAEFKAQTLIQKNMGKIMLTASKNKFADALMMIDKLLEESDSEIVKRQMASLQSNIEAQELSYLILKKNPQASERLKAQLENSEPNQINNIVWNSVCTPVVEGRQLDDSLIAISTEYMEKAVKSDPKSSYFLDTLAHLYSFQGKLDEAIDLQTQAVEHAQENVRESVTKFLDELKSKQK